MFFKRKEKTINLNITLKNFLSYMIDNYDNFSIELSNEYTPKEKKQYIYNCTINTIYEFMISNKTYLIPKIAFLSLTRLFKENMLLRQFHSPNIRPMINNKSTIEILEKFKCLTDSLNDNDKNKIMDDVNFILASTI